MVPLLLCVSMYVCIHVCLCCACTYMCMCVCRYTCVHIHVFTPHCCFSAILHPSLLKRKSFSGLPKTALSSLPYSLWRLHQVRGFLGFCGAYVRLRSSELRDPQGQGKDKSNGRDGSLSPQTVDTEVASTELVVW